MDLMILIMHYKYIYIYIYIYIYNYNRWKLKIFDLLETKNDEGVMIILITTPSISNYKSFQKFWRVKAFSSLTKITERNTKIVI